MLRRRFLRPLVLALSLVWCAAVTRAEERIDEIRRMHLEALGGKARVDALSGLRASGQVLAGGKRLRFIMIAARPVKLRLETESAGRTLVQGYSGEGEPWEFDTGSCARGRDLGPSHLLSAAFDGKFVNHHRFAAAAR